MSWDSSATSAPRRGSCASIASRSRTRTLSMSAGARDAEVVGVGVERREHRRARAPAASAPFSSSVQSEALAVPRAEAAGVRRPQEVPADPHAPAPCGHPARQGRVAAGASRPAAGLRRTARRMPCVRTPTARCRPAWSVHARAKGGQGRAASARVVSPGCASWARHSPMAAECLNPWPEQGDATMTFGHRGQPVDDEAAVGGHGVEARRAPSRTDPTAPAGGRGRSARTSPRSRRR